MEFLPRLRACTGFQWDEGNVEKSRHKHGVSRFETEEAFLNQPLIVADDDQHSDFEERYFALGQTNKNRLVFIVFAIRGTLIRPISSRDMTKYEREVYRSHG